jgi:hypothetical protein
VTITLPDSIPGVEMTSEKLFKATLGHENFRSSGEKELKPKRYERIQRKKEPLTKNYVGLKSGSEARLDTEIVHNKFTLKNVSSVRFKLSSPHQ